MLRTRGHDPRLERVIHDYSRAGEHGACWIALGLAGALLHPHNRSPWLNASKIVAGAYVANQVLKLAIRRRRPELDGLPPLTKTVSRLSFPSAHATTSFAAGRAYDVAAGMILGTAIGEAWPR